MATNYDTSDSSSSSDDMMGYILLRRRRVNPRVWVHDINARREELGEYNLVQELRDHPDRFFTYFRMSKEKFDELASLLQEKLARKNTNSREALSVEEQLVICLRFLSTGDSFTTIAFSYRYGHTTVCEAVYSVCDALWEVLHETLLPKPTEEMWKNCGNRFKERWNFPHCVGAMDGKHIIIEAPPNSGSLYFNYKKSFSIVLLAIVDANYCFTAVDIGAYGSCSDGGILNRSTFGRALEERALYIPEPDTLPDAPQLGKLPYIIVGDEAFPLKDYLLRPYPGKNLEEDKLIFNYRLSRARRISENVFGLLAQRWRVYHRRLKLHPENVEKVIKATVILHNFIQRDQVGQAKGTDGDEQPKSSENTENHSGMEDLDVVFRGNRPKAYAMHVRNTFKDYFVSPEGEVPWQYAIVCAER